MYDLGILGKLTDLTCDTVVKTGTDGEQHITFADRMVGCIASMNTDISHVKRVTGRDRALTHDGRDHRHSRQFY